MKFQFLIACVLTLFAVPCLAQDEFDADPKGYASGVRGQVMVLEPEAESPRMLQDSDPIFEGSRITSGEDAFAEIELLDGSDVSVDEATQIDVAAAKADAEQHERDVKLSILYGSLKVSVTEGFSKKSKFQITTPVAVAGVRGTEFAVSYESDDVSEVDVFDGEVAVAQDGAEEAVGAGESSEAVRGRGIRKSEMQAEKRERWEQVSEAMHLKRQQMREERQREMLERIRAENPDDPRLPDLERAFHEAGSDRTMSETRFDEMRQKMKDRRQERLQKMKEFSQKHGRERFERMRRFKGGKLTPEERARATEKMKERRQEMREKAQEKWKERREKIKEERKDRLKERKEKHQDKREDIRERQQDRRQKIQDRRQQRPPPKRPRR